ncbi:MAG TPA: anti-sigma factor antagonist [bacterium]|nr:anti-sigma factor antagonist [bacterium]HPN30623.1 anti-sigma factor antagonist [bacterium]
MFDAIIEKEGNVMIMSLSGRFDAYGSTVTDNKIKESGFDCPNAILDFGKIEYLSSAGIRSLLKIQKECAKKKGAVLISGASGDIKNVIDMTGMTKMFNFYDSLEEAKTYLKTNVSSSENSKEKNINGKKYALNQLGAQSSIIDVWSYNDFREKNKIEAGDFIQTNLEELEFAAGLGGLGMNKEQALSGTGQFLSARKFCGTNPADSHNISDFIIPEKPADAGMFVLSGFGISGKPAAVAEYKGHPVPLEEIIRDMFELIKSETNSDNRLLGFVIQAKADKIKSSFYKTQSDILSDKKSVSERKPAEENNLINAPRNVIKIGDASKRIDNIFSISLASTDDGAAKCESGVIKSFLDDMKSCKSKTGFLIQGNLAEYIDPENAVEQSADLNAVVKNLANIEFLKNVSCLDASSTVTFCRIWIFIPASIRPGKEKQIKIEVPEGYNFREEWSVITRRIYNDASRVVITPLHGGFSSATFRVNSFDKDGRKILPTVMKIGSVALTKKEVDAYKLCVEKFILNNSTTIMGVANCGEWSGLRYNFVGITGSSGKLTWLENIYKEDRIEKAVELFDRVFTDILKPWYGQPKWEEIKPYHDQNPGKLFSNILADAEKEMGISAESKTINCPELGIDLPNPYNFYKYEYPKRKNTTFHWYTGITHGDLNMKNIMIDDKENIYVIDFSECRKTNITVDFARLEPIVLFEMTKLENENDLTELLKFIQTLTQTKKLDDYIKFSYAGSDPMVSKAYKTICRMRQYADKVTLFETNLIPYILALLEWTYPVVSYISVPLIRKKCAVYTAAMLVKQIMDIEKK